MRIPLRRLVDAGLVVAVAGGCGGEPPSCDWCGTVVVATAGEAGTLFPPNARTQIDNGLIDLIFQRLAEIGPELNTIGDSGFSPALASSWSFDDPLTIRFTLDERARWHDGLPVTAQDVVFTFDVYRDTLLSPTAMPRIGRIESVEALDGRTVVVRFRDEYAEQFFDAVYHMRILPRHILDSIPRERLAAHPFGRRPVGSGPYRFVRWEAAQFVELSADSSFSLGRPGIPRVIWRFTPDLNTALTQLLAGEVDVLEFLGGPDNIRRVAENERLRVIMYPTLYYGYVAFNLRDPERAERPNPLFADRRLRRALAKAVDREAIVGAVLGEMGSVAAGPLTETYSVWSDSIPQIEFDSAAARRELAALGWRDSDEDGVLDREGRPLKFDLLVPATSTPRVQSAQVIQDQLRRLGIRMNITTLDFGTIFDRGGRAERGLFDAVYGSWGGDPSPGTVAEVWTTGGSANYGRYSNPRVDSLIRRAMSATSLAEAQPLWHRAIAAINDDAPAIFVYAAKFGAGVHRRFENVEFRPDQWTTTLWKWRVKPGRYIERDHLISQ